MAKKNKKEPNELEEWEVPDVDLNLRHYSGQPSDVIKKIKFDIEKYVNKPGVPEKNIQIYSAIYNALNYYKDISYIPSAEFGTGETFLSSTIKAFNEDYDFLDKKYNPSDPTQEKVVRFSGRIKSPLSFVNKVREKMTEYVNENRDFKYFNESLRDLIGMRIIVDIPEENVKLGPESEALYLYDLTYSLLEKRGILRDEDNKRDDDYSFIPVNSRYDSKKLEKMKNSFNPKSLNPELYDTDGNIIISIPESRPAKIENPKVDSVIKDYVKYPKFSGYQSLHLCIHPKFTQDIEKLPIPKGIIPPASRDYSFEYQIRSKKQDDFAERGLASHKSSYKPHGEYHRLQVPFYITFDSAQILSEDVYDIDAVPASSPNQIYNTNKLRLRNFGESYHKFYGVTFEEYFNIPFKKMRDLFDSNTRNDILARNVIVVHDEENDTYSIKDNKESTHSVTTSTEKVQDKTSSYSNIVAQDSILLCFTTEELENLKIALLEKDTAKLTMLYNKLGSIDNMYRVCKVIPEDESTPENELDRSTLKIRKQRPKKVTLITLEKEPKPIKSTSKTTRKSSTDKSSKTNDTNQTSSPSRDEDDSNDREDR